MKGVFKMNTTTNATTEKRGVSKRKKIMKIVIIIAVIIIPVLYSFFYLKAFWDPYGNLHDMKVAIVNLDTGDEGENLGNELFNKLKENDTLTYVEVKNREEGEKGLIDQSYYATITIPEDFTKTLNHAESEDRKQSIITYSPNQKSNYLASQIIAKVVTTVENELKGEVSQKVVAKLTNKLNEVPEKMQEISQGATQIQDGTTHLKNGLTTLKQGTETLANQYETFDQGVTSASQGSNELTQGITELAKGIDSAYQGTNQLASSTNQLEELTKGTSQVLAGSTNLADGLTQYVNGVNQTLSTVESSQSSTKSQLTSLASSLQAYTKTNPAARQDANFQKAMQTLQTISSQDSSSSLQQATTKLQTSGKELKQGINHLTSGAKSLTSGVTKLTELSNGVQTLNQGMIQLKQGVTKLQTGGNDLQNGLSTLTKASQEVKEGIHQINEGTNSAATGSDDLQNGVNTFKSEIDQGMAETKEQLTSLTGLDTYVQEPIKVEETDYAGVDSYGVGFAPYFMSISLWVGALIMLIIFYYDPEDRFKLLGRNANHKFLRSALYFAVAIGQGIVLGFLLKLGLGFNVTNGWLYYGTCILISLVFTSIMQFLILNFGDVGKFLGILLLVLQLAASAGTFPIETVPKFFQGLYSFMPMNYTIRLIKESLIKIDSGMIWSNVSVLLGILLVFIALTVLFDWLRIRKEKKSHKIENKS